MSRKMITKTSNKINKRQYSETERQRLQLSGERFLYWLLAYPAPDIHQGQMSARTLWRV